MMDNPETGGLLFTMPAAAIEQDRRYPGPTIDAINDHAITNFAQGVQFMAESENVQAHAQVGELVQALTREMQKQVRTKPHPLIYANLAFIITLVFAAGVLYQKVQELDNRVHSLASVDTISSRLQDMSESQNEMRRNIESLRERFDRFLDGRARGQ